MYSMQLVTPPHTNIMNSRLYYTVFKIVVVSGQYRNNNVGLLKET